ncbi:hypothetical protein HYW20_02435 [Candidatus Woesearchaeota archaeon]|nr:hypothetical protein [Candidatus Woesearchaeota archaeon]
MKQTKVIPPLEQIAKTAGRVASSHREKEYLGALADGVKSGREGYNLALKKYAADLEKYRAGVPNHKGGIPGQEPTDLPISEIPSMDATRYKTGTPNHDTLPKDLAGHMTIPPIPRPQSVAVLNDQNVRSYANSVGYLLQLVKQDPESLVPNDSVTTTNIGVINDLLKFERNTKIKYDPAVYDLVTRWAGKMAYRIRKNGDGAIDQQMVDNYHRLIRGVVPNGNKLVAPTEFLGDKSYGEKSKN